MDAAIAFVGKNPENVIKWPAKTTLVTAISEGRVKSGATSATGTRKLFRNGARLRSLETLHAKVYVFDRVAFIGSANASESSTALIEAAVKMTKPADVARARAMVLRLWRDASPVEDAMLSAWSEVEPQRLHLGTENGRQSKPRTRRPPGTARLRMPFLNGAPVWIDAVSPAPTSRRDEQVRQRKANALADDIGLVGSEVEWTSLERSNYRDIPEQAWVFVWWEPDSRSPYGRLEGPFRNLGGFDLGRSVQRRYLRAEHPIARRSLRLDGPATATLSTLFPRFRKHSSSREHAAFLQDHLGNGAIELDDAKVRRLGALVARLASR